ncbi:MAG: host attachment protein [Pseudomonadota bacterium]
MLLPHDTTIVVTDGQKLRLLRNTGTEFHLALTELPHPDVHGDVAGTSRHEHTGGDKQDHQEASYGLAVAKWLNHAIAAGDMGSLFVIAPPRALGELRQHYSEPLKKKLVGEMAKEHTNDTLHILQQVLRDA